MPSMQTYCKVTDKVVKCEACRKCLHVPCGNLSENELLELGSHNGSWYCKDCKAECGLYSGAVLNDHKAVHCDKYEMWVHNDCSFVSMKLCKIQVAPGFVKNVSFFNFSDSFFSEH